MDWTALRSIILTRGKLKQIVAYGAAIAALVAGLYFGTNLIAVQEVESTVVLETGEYSVVSVDAGLEVSLNGNVLSAKVSEYGDYYMTLKNEAGNEITYTMHYGVDGLYITEAY